MLRGLAGCRAPAWCGWPRWGHGHSGDVALGHGQSAQGDGGGGEASTDGDRTLRSLPAQDGRLSPQPPAPSSQRRCKNNVTACQARLMSPGVLRGQLAFEVTSLFTLSRFPPQSKRWQGGDPTSPTVPAAGAAVPWRGGARPQFVLGTPEFVQTWLTHLAEEVSPDLAAQK